MTSDICYGDNVRIRRTPETERLGIAEAIGNVYGETTPSESKVEVIGLLRSDYALQVYFDSIQTSYWFAPGMLEFVNHAPGTEVHVHGSPFKSVRQRDGTWKEVPIDPFARASASGDTLAAVRSQRRLIMAVLVATFCVVAFLSWRWVWRDIRYWSRSATVKYETDSLESCVAQAVAGMPGVSVISSGPPVSLQVPSQEGVIVKDTPEPRVARIVVYGHSESISTLGPAAEEPVANLLRELKTAISARCAASPP